MVPGEHGESSQVAAMTNAAQREVPAPLRGKQYISEEWQLCLSVVGPGGTAAVISW